MKNIEYKQVFLSILFCFGFLLILINVHYLYKYYEFVNINRKDLLARLPFISNTTGFIFYPLVLVLFIIISYFLTKNGNNSFKSTFLNLLIGGLLVGALFYGRVLGNLVYGTSISIVIGVVLLLISLLMIIISNKSKS